jgi:hypothetical protein
MEVESGPVQLAKGVQENEQASRGVHVLVGGRPQVVRDSIEEEPISRCHEILPAWVKPMREALACCRVMVEEARSLLGSPARWPGGFPQKVHL